MYVYMYICICMYIVCIPPLYVYSMEWILTTGIDTWDILLSLLLVPVWCLSIKSCRSSINLIFSSSEFITNGQALGRLGWTNSNVGSSVDRREERRYNQHTEIRNRFNWEERTDLPNNNNNNIIIIIIW